MSNQKNGSLASQMNNPEDPRVQRLQSLMSEGKSLAEALQALIDEAKPATTVARRDTVGFLKDCRDIKEVRRLKKIAYAKISKSPGKTDAIARYKEEIRVADEVLTELIKEINLSPIPWQKAMELGEDAAGAFNYYFQNYKEGADKQTDELAKEMKLTKADLKSMVNNQPTKIPSDIPDVLRSVAEERVKHGDMMVITVFRKVSFLASKVVEK